MNFSWLFKDSITNCLFFPIRNPPHYFISNIYPSGIILGSDWSLFVNDKTIDGCVFPLFSNFCPLEKSLVQLLSIPPSLFTFLKNRSFFTLIFLSSVHFLSSPFFFSSKEFQFATKMFKKKKKRKYMPFGIQRNKVTKVLCFHKTVSKTLKPFP